MRHAAAASPPNPPPTMYAFICLLPGLQVWEILPTWVVSLAPRSQSATASAAVRRIGNNHCVARGVFEQRSRLERSAPRPYGAGCYATAAAAPHGLSDVTPPARAATAALKSFHALVPPVSAS